jgi:dihydrodipicolinate synthase/N-acetylneuraminate lyase
MTTALRTALAQGLVIPAHPLALNANGRLDETRQRALSRYYLEAGAGGLAVGVHTTQFAIHRDDVGLYRPVLTLAAEEMQRAGDRTLVRVAGVIGTTGQASREASLAADLGYDCVLLSLAGLADLSEVQLIDHCRAVAEILPVFGFYLQPDVGGIALPYSFWRRFCEIENVVAIKIAAFNRYRTLDIVRATADAGRDDIALYTGNDDSIVFDLLTPYEFLHNGQTIRRWFAGGLLGHWAVWTRAAVQLLQLCRSTRAGSSVPRELLIRAGQVTDCNAAIFDAANRFHGCIPGIHEVLRRQGLLQGNWCLDPRETLSTGQLQEIDRVYRAYPLENDDAFVAAHLHDWLA